MALQRLRNDPGAGWELRNPTPLWGPDFLMVSQDCILVAPTSRPSGRDAAPAERRIAVTCAEFGNLVTSDCAYRSPQHSHIQHSSTNHDTIGAGAGRRAGRPGDRSREGRERKNYAWAAAEPTGANDAYRLGKVLCTHS